jgi:uncharacterized protein YdaT
MSKSSGQHVVPRNGKWGVLKSGASRTSGTYDTQKEAVEKARELAKTQRTELYIHGANGLIRDRRSYGRDPHPPKG